MKAADVLKNLSEICRRKHLSYATEKSYAGWARSYIRALPKFPRSWTSERKAETFLTGLAQRDVAAATQNQALNAIAFLYKEVLGTPLGTVDALRVRRPATVRTALNVDETRALLGAMEDCAGYPTRLVARLLYGCGLRVSEPLELRIKDVDLEGARIVIRSAKGNKDRIVPLPQCLLGEMEAQLRVARAVCRADADGGSLWRCPRRWRGSIPNISFRRLGLGSSRRRAALARAGQPQSGGEPPQSKVLAGHRP